MDPRRRTASAGEFAERLRARQRDLPSGVVTFLATEVVDADELWASAPLVMPEVCDRLDGLVAEEVESRGGRVVQSTTHDHSTLSAFPTASGAEAAALAIHVRLKKDIWGHGITVRLRAALHSGEVQPRDGAYRSGIVNLVAHLCALAPAGGTLVSGVTASLLTASSGLVPYTVESSAGATDLSVGAGTYLLTDVGTTEPLPTAIVEMDGAAARNSVADIATSPQDVQRRLDKALDEQREASALARQTRRLADDHARRGDLYAEELDRAARHLAARVTELEVEVQGLQELTNRSADHRAPESTSVLMTPRRRRPRTWTWLAVGILLVVAAGVVVIVYARGPSVTLRVVQAVHVEGAHEIAAGSHDVWVTANTPNGRVVRIDARTGQVTGQSESFPQPLSNIVEAPPNVFTGEGTGAVVRLALATLHVEQQIPTGPAPNDIVAGANVLYVSDAANGTVSRITPTSVTTLARLPVPLADISLSGDELWAAQLVGPNLFRIDVTSGQWQQIDLDRDLPAANPTRLVAVVAAYGSVWVTDSANDELIRFDPHADHGIRIHVGRTPWGVCTGGRWIWVVNREDATVSRVDPTIPKVTGTVKVGDQPDGVGWSNGDLWVAAQGSDTVDRIDPGS
jgi:streptogramin lyase